jgi:3-phenylpropionate/cinnamic acid dioxygenase small subunit
VELVAALAGDDHGRRRVTGQPGSGELQDLLRWQAVTAFLFREAELLDDNRLTDWLALLSQDVRYTMPVRVSVPRADLDRGIDDGYAHFDEDYESLSYRVSRALQPDAHAEAVPSRTRRFVTNVQVSASGGTADRLSATSYLLLTRSQFASPDYGMVTAVRYDELASRGTGLVLASRRVVVDQSTLGLTNLAVFL